MSNETPVETPTSGSDIGSNTINNTQQEKRSRGPGKPFVKGDPRINRHGAPKKFEALRKLAVKMLSDPIVSRDGTVSTNYVELILRDWLQSRNFQKQKSALEIAYGKVPDEINMNIDLTMLTTSQLERLAKGEDILSVLTKPRK